MMIFEIVRFVGVIIRQFFLPNPFDLIWPEQAFFINSVVGVLLIPISYYITGIWYHRGDGAAIGSFLFNLVYVTLTLILWGAISIIVYSVNNPFVPASVISVLGLAVVSVLLVKRHFTNGKQLHFVK